jgi:hypothetical protein
MSIQIDSLPTVTVCMDFGHYTIPVTLHHGMTVADETNTKVLGGQESGNYGQFVSKGGFAIHISLCSPDVLGTFLHEFAHLVMFQRSHLLAFSDEQPLPNLSETICDLVSDAFAELYQRNSDLLDMLAQLKPEKLTSGEVAPVRAGSTSDASPSGAGAGATNPALTLPRDVDSAIERLNPAHVSCQREGVIPCKDCQAWNTIRAALTAQAEETAQAEAENLDLRHSLGFQDGIITAANERADAAEADRDWLASEDGQTLSNELIGEICQRRYDEGIDEDGILDAEAKSEHFTRLLAAAQAARGAR